ncbi:MAG: hypothetical protein ABF625_09775 [Leuconostoc mesenteroides]
MFNSVMFKDNDRIPKPILPGNSIFQDLELTKLFTQVNQISGYTISDFNYQPLNDSADIVYRQQVFNDLKDKSVFQAVQKFVDQMTVMYDKQVTILGNDSKEARDIQLVNILDSQLKAVESLQAALQSHQISSEALKNFFSYLKEYLHSEIVINIKNDIQYVRNDFQNVFYRLSFCGRDVQIEAYPSKRESIDDKFREVFSSVFEHPGKMLSPIKMTFVSPKFGINNLQVNILKALSKLYSQPFAELNRFFDNYSQYEDRLMVRIVSELKFYLVWGKVENSIEEKTNLNFTNAKILRSGTEKVKGGFDFNLAISKLEDCIKGNIVTNDFEISPSKPFLVVSGPNQGGKTTFARMIGQIYYLMNLGIPVPGSNAKLRIRTKLFTHFDRQESSRHLTGLLESDVRRIHDIIEKIDDSSFVILNELFSSTTAADASELGDEVLNYLIKRKVSGVYVTFLESLGSHKYVQPMMSQVDDKGKRLFRIIPQKLDNKAYM